MPTETGTISRRIAIEGSLRVSCEDFNFRLRYAKGAGIADFPSLGMLTRAGKIAKDFGALIAELPPLPPSIDIPGRSHKKGNPFGKQEFLIAVNARPVGRLSFETGKPKFIPTPLRFFRKI